MLGAYYLLIKFGETVLPINVSNLQELTISQDLNKFLPEFRLRLSDNSGVLTHISPLDKNMSKVYIELAPDQSSTDKNSFTFDVYRRQPGGNQSSPAAVYDISGLGNVPNLFAPDFSRSFSGNVQTNLQNLATSEFLVDKTNIGSSLNYERTLLQAQWTNVQFLNYLTEHLAGVAGEYGYKCSIQVQNSKKIFLFKSLLEMMKNQTSYKFILSDRPYQDQHPVYNYYIYDNYKLYGAFGNRQQSYSYFDWDTGTFVSNTLQVQDFYSLSDYFAIDKSDPTVDNQMSHSGRSNAFDLDFEGWAKGNYSNRLLDLVKMWITTEGLPNVVPGQVAQVFFPQGAAAGDLYSYQYSGYWLIEKVVHNCGDMFVTKLLLTRHGWDTDKRTTLLPANISKRV